jgi:capsular polysaccharide biosynthesis protein
LRRILVCEFLNVSIAQPPSKPLGPVVPKVWLNVLAGIVLAAGFALGAAYWEEQSDQRIYSRVAIAEASGLETIAVLSGEG